MIDRACEHHRLRERRGDLYALLLSVLEGVFPVLTRVTVTALGALHAYFYTIVIATLALLLLLWRQGGLGELFDRVARRDLLLTSLLITSLFVMIFMALRYTTAGHVAVILVLQLFFSWLYFNAIGSERMSLAHSAGAALMGLGAIVILFPEDLRINAGDWLALAAAAIAPIANHFQQRARRRVSSLAVLAFRNAVALPALGLLAVALEPPASSAADPRVLPWLVVNALLIFVAAKVLWVEALNHISVTRLSAMASFIPVFTMVFAWLLLGETPGLRQLLGMAPVVIGALLLTRPDAFHTSRT